MTSVRDIGIVAVVLFVLAITMVFSIKTTHTVLDKMVTVPVINTTPAASAVIVSVDSKVNLMDYIYFCTFLGFFISILIFGWLSGSNPVFVGIYFFVLIMFTFIAVLLQQVWVDIVVSGGLALQLSELPMTAYIMAHIGYFIALAGLLGILFSFGKVYYGKTV